MNFHSFYVPLVASIIIIHLHGRNNQCNNSVGSLLTAILEHLVRSGPLNHPHPLFIRSDELILRVI